MLARESFESCRGLCSLVLHIEFSKSSCGSTWHRWRPICAPRWPHRVRVAVRDAHAWKPTGILLCGGRRLWGIPLIIVTHGQRRWRRCWRRWNPIHQGSSTKRVSQRVSYIVGSNPNLDVFNPRPFSSFWATKKKTWTRHQTFAFSGLFGDLLLSCCFLSVGSKEWREVITSDSEK